MLLASIRVSNCVRFLMNFIYICSGGFRRPLLALFAAWLLLSCLSSQAQTVLNVTNFGARGDAVSIVVNTVSNSTLVTTTSSHSSGDIGKTIELFGAGPLGTSTNHQDLLATITNIVNGTNLYLSIAAHASFNGCSGYYGTNNAAAFQACINAAPSNSIINIPNGSYLIIGSQAMNPSFAMSSPFDTYPSITIQKGGLTLQGQSRSNTVLLGCGAWQLKGSNVYRGHMFGLVGPVTNNGPLIFNNLTMDGGVPQGYTGYLGWPASTANGDGWDVTHDAVLDEGTPPLHADKTFMNCTITRWRGEQFKSVVANWDGQITISNCSFTEGDASGINFSFSHNIENCYFADLAEAMEFYQGYCSNICYFQNSVITNMAGALMAINGSQIGSPNPTYNIIGNSFFLRNGQNGVQTTPAENLNILENQFIGPGIAIPLGIAGYQGTAPNSNIVIAANMFSNVNLAIALEGNGANAVYNVLISNNIASYPGGAGFAYGYGWGTNVLFVGNTTTGLSYGLNSTLLSGQFFIDDASNQFPPNAINDTVGQTNLISYMYGMRQQIAGARNNSIFALDDTHPLQIPPGARLQITNTTQLSEPLYLSASLSGQPVIMAPSVLTVAQWANGAWQVASQTLTTLPAPSDLHVISPGN